MLTQKQYDLLMYVNDRVRESGVAPSFTEMAAAMDLKTKSGIHRLLTALEERGFIRRMAKRSRAIEVVQLPRNVEESLRPATSREQMPRATARCGTAVSRPSRPLSQGSALQADGSVLVPVVGRIAAGTPIESLQNRIADVPVPGSMIGRGDHYALEIAGDSMISAGILDGDTVIICETDTCNTGEIVVVLIDGAEATLRRLRRRGEHFALEAANPAYETRIYLASRIRVQGKLVGLVRRY